MNNLPEIATRIRENFTAKNAARDTALERSRSLIRYCALSIRATHRDERDEARGLLAEARKIVDAIRADLAAYPDLYHAGYTQDALKEFAEASIVLALVVDDPLPEPEALGVEYAAYLNGLGEAASEMRRRCLDIIRHDHTIEAERLLNAMDEIYSLLVTVDYPDAITGGLRRTTDLVRGVTERTRGDLTMSMRQQRLQEALKQHESGPVS
ncbi:MAG: haloacid dehalogenase [Chloroflexi bacterium]|nr:haloacid dehalogenase [Chloroflexota bacterium]MBI5291144.1 haloacid dehalogenase [Chloroflexota bacterium]MBI5829186.1 haloacid dehalogenase [Chloroflexota bacterium]